MRRNLLKKFCRFITRTCSASSRNFFTSSGLTARFANTLPDWNKGSRKIFRFTEDVKQILSSSLVLFQTIKANEVNIAGFNSYLKSSFQYPCKHHQLSNVRLPSYVGSVVLRHNSMSTVVLLLLYVN